MLSGILSAPVGRLLLGLLAVPVVACGRTDSGASPDPKTESTAASVLLVTLDTCRADRIGCYGNDAIETPNLDGLAREGTLFEHAFTPIPSTLPSHCSIMTGLYPAQHGVHDNGIYALEDGIATLAECFRDAGYRTAAFVAAFVLDHQFGLSQGFETYDDRMVLPLVDVDPRSIARRNPELPEAQRRWMAQLASPYQRRAQDVTEAATAWLDEIPDAPFFLWVHYFDAHQPYAAPGRWERRYDPNYKGKMDGTIGTWLRVTGESPPEPSDHAHMVARYDGEISYVDHWLGRLLEQVRSTGRLSRTLVVVVGDHGEGFGEHRQLWEHNAEVFDEAVHVPLIIRQPDGTGAGRRVSALVRTIDVAPTVLELTAAGVTASASRTRLGEKASGVSLAPLCRGATDGDSTWSPPGSILLETGRAEQVLPRPRSILGLRTDSFKMILALDRQDTVLARGLYDVVRDPLERLSVAGARADLAERLTAEILRRHAALARPRDTLPIRGIDAMTSDALRALGYTGK